MIFDTHAHYDDSAFDEDRQEILESLKDEEIDFVVNVASGLSSCITTMKLTEEYSFVYGAVGIHPAETDGLTMEDMKLVEEYCHKDKILAIGEIGLDYHYSDIDKEQQKKCFIWQLDIARRNGLPVIIHSRDAAEDTMNIMKEEKASEIGGVVHCYSYSSDMAKQYVDMGFFIGVGGVVTFKNSKKLKEVVEAIPIERIVLETDCPYLAPEPYRGHRNSSLNLKYVISTISQIKGISEDEVKRITYQNARQLYRMD